jgi:separase
MVSPAIHSLLLILTRCSIETLETARNLQESQLNASSQNDDQRPPEKHSIDKLMSDASYVYSLLALAKGDPMLALYHAKRCVILNIRTWTLIERKSRTEEGPYEKEDSSVEMDSMVDGVSKLAVAEDQLSVPQTFFRSGRGSAFWSFVPRHYYGLSNLSAISAHLGLFQDSFYYAEQAQKLVEAVNAKALMIYNKSLRGLICSRGGHVDTARDLLNDSMSALGSLEPTKSTVLNHSTWADFCLRSGDHHQAQRSIVKARQVLSMISGAEFLGRRQLATQTPALEEVMASLTLDDAAPKQHAISRKIVGPKKGIKARQPPKSAKTKLPANAPSTKMEISTLNRLEGMLLRRKAESLIVSRNLPDASSTLAEAEDVQIHQADRLEHQLLVTRQMLLDVLRQLSSHAVYCVLSDSTISYPSAKGSEKGKGRRTSLLSPRTAKFDPSSTAQIKRANMASRGIRARTPIQDDFLDLLNRIREILLDVHGTAYKFCSTKALHDISFLQSRLSLILHATKPELSTRPIHTANYSGM